MPLSGEGLRDEAPRQQTIETIDAINQHARDLRGLRLRQFMA
jgi:hypothetical protein